MKIKLGRYEVALARDNTRAATGTVKKPKTDGAEQGTASAGGSSVEYFGNEFREPKIADIMKMIDNDGTAAMLYTVMTVPLQASNWYLQPDPADVVVEKDADGNTVTRHPQADFVDECLRNPEHKGGMSTPFSNIIANICLAVAQGHRFFEIVYKIRDDGKIVFKKVVAREPDTYEIETDDTGGFAGVTQNVKRNGRTVKVFIDIPYSFLFTYRKERKPLIGMTAFRAAYYHYDKKHRLYYLMNQQGQVSAIPIKSLEQPDAQVDDKVRDANLAAVDKLAVRPSIALPFGWKLTVHDMKPGLDLSKYVDHHDTQMARSTLTQGQLLGNQSQSQGGSYALAETHWDTFMFNERAMMTSVEEHITSYLVAKLVDFNFAQPLYPTFKFSDLTDGAMALLEEAFKSLVTKGSVPDWVSDGIATRVAERLEIDKPELDDDQADAVNAASDQIQQQALNGAQVSSLLEIVTGVVTGSIPPETAKATILASFPLLTPQVIDNIIDPAYKAYQESEKKKTAADDTTDDAGNGDTPPPNDTPPTDENPNPDDAEPPQDGDTTVNQSKRPKARATLDAGADEWWRELTAPEAKVQFAKIQRAADAAEAELVTDLREHFETLRADTVKRLRPLLERDGADGIDGFTLRDQRGLEAIYSESMLATYSDAKRDAANEIKLRAPGDKRKSKKLLKQYAAAVAEKQYNDLLSSIQLEVIRAARANQLDTTTLSVDDLLALIGSIIGKFFGDKGPITAGVVTTSAINVGRNDVFTEYADKIHGYLYSAILDSKVCNTCYDLDGSVCTLEEYAATEWMPPIHFWCRCIWVAIMKDEEELPEFTGLPDNPGGERAPLLSHSHNHNHMLKLAEEI